MSYNRKLVLASASVRRSDILRTLGIPFEVEAASIDETPLPGEDVLQYVDRLARTKAETVSRNRPDRVVLAADTVVTLGGLILGKPESREQARGYLGRLSGRSHTVITGLCVVVPGNREPLVTIDTTTVWFGRLNPHDIEWYLDRNEWPDAAGGYQIQNAGAALVSRIEGDYGTVVGLPIHRVYSIVRSLGVPI